MSSESVFNRVSQQSPLLIVARNSTYGALKGRTMAAQESQEIVARLARDHQIDLRTRVPSVQRIIDDLAHRSTKASHARWGGGAEVHLEYVEYDLGDVVVVVCTGSGKTVTEDLRQPFVDLLCEKLAEYQPCVLAINRFDRIGRAGAALTGQLMGALEHRDIFLADESSVRRIDEMQGLFGSVQALASRAEAEALHRKTRQGLARGTARQWSPEGCAFAIAYVPPAGMLSLRLKDERGGKGVQWLVLDDPDHHPAAELVAYGLPPVKSDNPRHSNMADVMWALSVLGSKGWTYTEVSRELTRRGFSSPGLRRHHSIDTDYSDANIPRTHSWRVLRPILRRLDFYRTGDLPIRLNHPDVPDFVLSGVFPPGGAWARPEDFARIDAYLATTVGGGPASLPLVGVPVRTVAGEGVLGCAALEGKRDQYVVRMTRRVNNKRCQLTTLPHRVVADSLVDGLLAAADDVLIPVQESYPTSITAMQSKVTEAERHLEELRGKAGRLLDQIVETHPDGSYVLNEVTRAGISQRYQDMVDHEVAAAEQHVAELGHKVAEERQRWAEDRTAIEDNLLLHLVAALREPTATEWNQLIKRAVRIDEMTSEPIVRHRHKGTRVRWRGTVSLSGMGQVFEIAFAGHYDFGSVTTLDAKVDRIIEAMSQGVPFPSMFDKASPHYLPRLDDCSAAVGERLGWNRRCPLMSCPHPLLTKVGTHLALHGRQVAQAAEMLDQPVELVAAVDAVLDSGRPDWRGLIATLHL